MDEDYENAKELCQKSRLLIFHWVRLMVLFLTISLLLLYSWLFSTKCFVIGLFTTVLLLEPDNKTCSEFHAVIVEKIKQGMTANKVEVHNSYMSTLITVVTMETVLQEIITMQWKSTYCNKGDMGV